MKQPITSWNHTVNRSRKYQSGYATGKLETTEYDRNAIIRRREGAALLERTPYRDGYLQALTDYLAYGHLANGANDVA